MLRLVCSSHFFQGKREKKKIPTFSAAPPFPPLYLGPNEQFTWLVKEVVPPAKAEGGETKTGLRQSSFPTGGAALPRALGPASAGVGKVEDDGWMPTP